MALSFVFIGWPVCSSLLFSSLYPLFVFSPFRMKIQTETFHCFLFDFYFVLPSDENRYGFTVVFFSILFLFPCF
ncbi:hypothetical protein HQ29_09810 [Porphyromonas canoris]|nr:hypothetical protein HQ29_09810 [Porphyromonas canoris]